jgi:hypothetical protein
VPRVRTTKTLAKRIDLQYFTRMDGFRKWRLGLSVALCVLAVGWIAYATVFHQKNLYTKGPLSAAHSVFTTNCELCHLRGTSFRAAVPDSACLRCHDAPQHNERQTFTPQCTSCHVEHIGKARIAEVSDSGCVQCHGDLPTKDGQHSVNPHIRGFDKNHPDFAVLQPGQTDPGTINFNHHAHLQNTIRGPLGAVQLVCNDCHRPTNMQTIAQGPWPYSVATVQPASQQPVSVSLADSQQRKRRSVRVGAGAYMEPIRYVNQCAACHVLQFDSLIPEPAPHDKPAVVDAFIRKKYADYLAAHPEAQSLSASGIDNGTPVGRTENILRPTLTKSPAPATSPADWVERRTAEAERLLWNKNCKICHMSTEHTGPGLPQSVKAIIPTRWLARSEFDHQAHMLLNCDNCHKTISASRETSEINLPPIAQCRQCHKEGGPSRQAAEGRCFECHSYHDWRKERRVNGIMDITKP